MNPIYSIMESPHRWWILSGLGFGAGSIGAIAMIAWNWPHGLAKFWFYAGLLAAVFFAIRGVMQWRDAALGRQPVQRSPLAAPPRIRRETPPPRARRRRRPVVTEAEPPADERTDSA